MDCSLFNFIGKPTDPLRLPPLTPPFYYLFIIAFNFSFLLSPFYK